MFLIYSIEQQQRPISEIFLIKRVRLFIEEAIMENQTAKQKKLLDVINMDNKYNQLIEKLKDASTLKLEMIKEVRKTKPNITIIEKIADKFCHITKHVDNDFNSLKRENVNTIKLIEIYSAYF